MLVEWEDNLMTKRQGKVIGKANTSDGKCYAVIVRDDGEYVEIEQHKIRWINDEISGD